MIIGTPKETIILTTTHILYPKYYPAYLLRPAAENLLGSLRLRLCQKGTLKCRLLGFQAGSRPKEIIERIPNMYAFGVFG